MFGASFVPRANIQAMTIKYRLEPDDWSNVFTRQFLADWSVIRLNVLWQFNWLVKHGNIPNAKLTGSDIFREMRALMPRARGKQNDTVRHNDRSGKQPMQQQPIKWLNIDLTDADIDHLLNDDTTFEFLAAAVCGLAVDGVGISIKSPDSGKSYGCTLIRSDLDGSGNTYGLSAFADSPRNAILACLYKLDNYLGGDFTDCDSFVRDTRQNRAFR